MIENKSDKISILCASLMAGEGIENGFTKACRETFTGGYWSLNPAVKNFNQELLRITKEYSPDCIFLQIQAEGIIDLKILQEISKLSWVMQWSGDIRAESPPQHYLHVASIIHLSSFSNMKDVQGVKDKGYAAEWMEIGYDPEIFSPMVGVENRYDIVAHFNHYHEMFPLSGYRLQIVEKLKENFGDRFAVFGNFPGAIGNFNSDQKMESRNYNSAKIAINCSHFFSDKYSSDRLLRILGSGTACVSHHFPRINEIYKVGEHLYTFINLDDMIHICKWLLRNEETRMQLAHNGQQHVLKNFTFQKMAENIKNFYLQYAR